MAQENQRTARKASSVRSGRTASSGSSSSARPQRRSYASADQQRTERQRPSRQPARRRPVSERTSSGRVRTASPKARPEAQKVSAPQTIFLNSSASQEEQSTAQKVSLISRIKKKYNDAVGSSDAGSSYKRQLAQRNMRNDLIKKGIIALAVLIILILAVVFIVNKVQVKDVSNLTIDSTATTQTLSWTGARKGLTYEVYRAEGSGGEYTLVEMLADGENSRTYDNLTAGTLYKYKIVVEKGKNEKTNGVTREAYTKPNAITSAAAATTAEKSLTAVWKLQGSTETYELKYSLYDNGRDSTLLSFPAEEASYNSVNQTYSYTIPDLVLGQTYYLSMRTICGDYASEWSSMFSGIVSDEIVALNVDADLPMVALTFDSGPDGGTVTSRILDVLQEYDAHATFFQTGANAQLYPDLMQRMVHEGHEIGNHTYDDSHLGDEVTSADILDANTAIQSACGVSPKLFRAPQGLVTDTILETCTDADMGIVLWNFDSYDWQYYDPSDIILRIQAYVENGDIIQFRNIYDETAAAIETLVPYLVDQGYQLVTVSQLIQAKTGENIKPGSIYRSAYDIQ